MSANLNVGLFLLTGMMAAIQAGGAPKPDKVPVSVEFSVPPDMKTGDEVTTVLKFRALADIQRLEVKVAPFAGVELTSDVTAAVFTNVKRGQAPQLEVKVRLTDPEFGSLAVTYRTRTTAGDAAGAITIVYGTPPK